jgi:hypothetical protein
MASIKIKGGVIFAGSIIMKKKEDITGSFQPAGLTKILLFVMLVY